MKVSKTRRSRPKFEINDENKKLLTAFKENNFIDNFQENPEKRGYYKIIRPKSLQEEFINLTNDILKNLEAS